MDECLSSIDTCLTSVGCYKLAADFIAREYKAAPVTGGGWF